MHQQCKNVMWNGWREETEKKSQQIM